MAGGGLSTQRLCFLRQLDADCVNVKAATTEKLGFAGRDEGIAAHAVVLLAPIAERPSGYDVIP